MTYVEKIISQLRRPGIVKIVMQLTEYYETYGDYDGEDDEIFTYYLESGVWHSSHEYVDADDAEHYPWIGGVCVCNSLDDVIDDIVLNLYYSQYSIHSIKTFVEGDTIGTDVDF